MVHLHTGNTSTVAMRPRCLYDTVSTTRYCYRSRYLVHTLEECDSTEICKDILGICLLISSGGRIYFLGHPPPVASSWIGPQTLRSLPSTSESTHAEAGPAGGQAAVPGIRRNKTKNKKTKREGGGGRGKNKLIHISHFVHILSKP